MHPEFPTPTRIFEFLCDFENCFSRLNAESHLWLVRKNSSQNLGGLQVNVRKENSDA